MNFTYEDLLKRLTDLRALARPAPEGERSGSCSSFDRRSQYDPQTGKYLEWGANRDGRGAVRTLEDGTVVAAELEGPGVIWRSWSAMPNMGAIRIFVDGECVIDRPFLEYFTRFGSDFAPLNLPSLCPNLSRGYNSFLPIPFNRSLRIELAPGWGAYYHFTYTLFPADTVLPSYADMFCVKSRVQLAKLDRALYRRGESDRLATSEANETLASGNTAVLYERQGKGAISRMEIRLDQNAMAVCDQLMLRMYWDGESVPAVSAPVSDFFSCTPQAGNFRTWVSGKIGDTLYTNWYMPFAAGAKIEVENGSSKDVLISASFAEEDCDEAESLLRFHALQHGDDEAWLADPAFQPGGERWPDWLVLSTKGQGRFCGVHLKIEDRYAYPDGLSRDEWWFGYGGETKVDWWWGEGDEKFFVDGEKFPSTFGTGSEDYVGYAWAAEPPFALFDAPFAAMSDMPLDGNGITSVCRFHVCDNVPFETSFEAYWEKYKANVWDESNTCIFTATPYWYQK